MIISMLARGRLLKGALCLFVAFGTWACTGAEKESATTTLGASANSNSTSIESKPAGSAAKKGSTLLPAEIADSTVKSLDEGDFRLADYKGKVVVLDLWATWCGPCRMEIPHLVEISKEYGGRGVEVIGLSTEEPEEATEAVRDFAGEYNINYKLGWTNKEIQQLIIYGGNSIPQTLVIAGDGTVVLHQAGFDPGRTPQKLRAAIEQALARQG
jgi:thiol-disulfide isomerase/thioredoxin